MAVARSIFTLGGQVQLFWTAFDMPVTGVPLKVALGYKKMFFLALQKNNHRQSLDNHLPDYFFETPKNQICAILMQILIVLLWTSDEKLSKTIEPFHLK